MTDEVNRAHIEEAGFEALQRLYAAAIDEAYAHAGIVARFLLGLYNGARFPFDLTDLRLLENGRFDDCLAVLRLDSRITRKEIHGYFQDGGAKFERLVSDWQVEDFTKKLKETGDGAPRPAAQRGALHHGDTLNTRVVTCADAPGYRDVSFTFDCELVGDEREAVGQVRLTLNVSPGDGVRVMEHIRHVHRFAWDEARKPLDADAGEGRPSWLDQP